MQSLPLARQGANGLMTPGALRKSGGFLYAIHQQLKEQSRGGPGARYEIDRVLPISADVIVTHVARFTLDENGDPVRPSSDESAAFSEMAMYVLARRGGQWWLAAGQNTPIRPGGAA